MIDGERRASKTTPLQPRPPSRTKDAWLSSLVGAGVRPLRLESVGGWKCSLQTLLRL